jgi:hypothetical protein
MGKNIIKDEHIQIIIEKYVKENMVARDVARWVIKNLYPEYKGGRYLMAQAIRRILKKNGIPLKTRSEASKITHARDSTSYQIWKDGRKIKSCRTRYMAECIIGYQQDEPESYEIRKVDRKKIVKQKSRICTDCGRPTMRPLMQK